MNNRILIVGTENEEALEGSYRRAFTHLGWHVQIWDPQQAITRSAKLGRIGSIACRYLVIEPWLRTANLELIELVSKSEPHILLVIGTSGLLAGTLGQIRARSPKTLLYCIYPDSPHNLDSLRIAALPLFDQVFTSSPAWVSTFSRLGCSAVTYLPFAADTIFYRPESPGASVPSAQVAFVGNWRQEREEILNELCAFDLEVWGSNYWRTRTKSDSMVRKKWKGRRLPASELPAISSRASIMLNIIDGHTWPGPNMRCFELAGCGAFQLVTRTPTVSEIFSEGTNIECFETVEEARSKIDHYLRNDEGRMRIAQAGRQLILDRNHTYTSRAESIIQLVGDLHTSQSVNN